MPSVVVAVLAVLAALLSGGLFALWFLLQTPRDRLTRARLSVRAIDRQKGRRQALLQGVSEGLYRVDPEALDQAEPPAVDAPIVVYFTGTGESPHAPLAAYRRLIAACPELCTARHHVVEAPSQPGAYYGSMAFSSRVWARLEGFVKAEEGPFILLGFSRGALAALDVGARIVEEQSKVASVLAMSAPLVVPSPLPPTVVSMARFSRVTDALSAHRAALPPWAVRHLDAVVQRVYLWLTAVIQAELSMEGPENLSLCLTDVELYGPVPISERAAREFRLLVEAPDRELEHFTNALASALARTSRLHATLVWGEHDTWAPAALCAARLQAALEREAAPSDQIVTKTLPGRGHGLFREHAHDVAVLARLLSDSVREARARFQASRERQQRNLSFEARLRTPPPPPGTDHE